MLTYKQSIEQKILEAFLLLIIKIAIAKCGVEPPRSRFHDPLWPLSYIATKSSKGRTRTYILHDCRHPGYTIFNTTFLF